ncbi:RHS repeat-associated core domain-containing protein [Simkania negevensis]|uniref:Teneurin-like YD-shell domain-containing protein n=1 Tax=Simkania negevensis (strain ATCC VR-1471 / DSM 27360 / Z) TaxID=331113 RepID=F8L4J1_SIMNZ|nr:RHS repeat-associated core domain-containing protein [Simkania negevensis]CCB90244.1 hypothetical protein SNE_A23670 [Simkania negevensis Z]
MLKKLLFFLVACSVLIGDEDPYLMSDFGGEPSGIVEGCVNVITGDYVVRRDDLVVKGQEPIRLPLNYSPREIRKKFKVYGGWNFAEKFLTIELNRRNILTVYEKSGIRLDYDFTVEDAENSRPLKLREVPGGWTNTAVGEITARFNPLNNKVKWKPHDHKEIVISTPDGGTRYYRTKESLAVIKTERFERYAPVEFFLRSEALPNGNVISYEWEKLAGKRWRVRRILSKSPSGKVYGSVMIDYDPADDKNRKGLKFVASDGRTVQYKFDSKYYMGNERLSILQNIEYSFKPNVQYNHWRSKRRDMYPRELVGPDGRSLKLTYYTHGWNADGGISIKDKPIMTDKRYARVQSLYQPFEGTNEFERTHMFRYSPGEYKEGNGSTDVFDAQMNLTRYDYNENFVLTTIERYFGKHTLFSKENFEWTDKSWLKKKSLNGEDKKALLTYAYAYDEHGNVLSETHFGNLKGEGESSYVIHRTYYDNHLLKSETFPNGKVVEYFYVGKTDLLHAKWERSSDGSMQRRTTYDYEDAVLVRETVDDGTSRKFADTTGVTRRLVKRINPNPAEFMYGMPHVVEEGYEENGQEIFLKKRIIYYDKEALGNASRIEHYDATGEHRYTLHFHYDEEDRLVEQIDPLGRVRKVDYDVNYNPIFDHDPNENFVLTQRYDNRNRPTVTEQTTISGNKREVAHHYNSLGQKVKEIDFRGNATLQEYDPFGHPTKTVLPKMATAVGYQSPEIKRTYNALGKPISETDPEGYETRKWYNARGKPIRILYPDGAEETFTYDLLGQYVMSYTSAEGTKTEYDYDVFDRIIAKRILSAEGTLLSQESFIYDAFKLLSKTDPDGVATSYSYDGVGRKVQEEVLGRVTTYEYDALGRMHRIARWKDNHPEQVLVKDYDLLDRVIEERQEDGDGLVHGLTTYTYDDFSNKIAVIKEVQVGDAIERTEYDPFRRIVKQIDALGHVTTIDYDDYYENELRQKVLRTITTDPMGRKTLETFDVFGNLVLLEKQDAMGKTLLKEAFIYNLNQKKTKQVSTLFDPDKTIVKSWAYDSRSRLIELKEAVGEPIEKITRYTYTLDGHLDTITKPDGTTITYTYDGLGRQTSIQTSDGSCHYALKYDLMGNVIESQDLLQGNATSRVYSHFGELLAETQANYQRLLNTYDDLGRRTAMIFANGSKVLYDYTPYHMAKVERISRNGTSLYAHYYTEYDRSFNLTEERLLSKEPLYHTVDLLSRRIESDSPYSNERITYIDPCGNVRGYKRTLDKAIETSTFEYDDLNQLIQEYGLYNHNYAYDAHHNRLQKDDSTYKVNPLHELEATSEGTYEHDLNGNRISSSKNQAQYVYDGLDRLVQIRSGDLAIRFSYDSWNRCQTAHYLQLNDGIWQHHCAQEFLYDDLNELGVYPRQLRILGQGKGAEIGAAIAIEQDQKIYLPIHDLFGNIIALLDPKTNIAQESYRYTVYGEEEIFAPSGSQLSDSFLHNPWRYQSKRKVGQLVAFGRRFYDPETGRWLSPDPKGFDEGPNLYQFLVNCPMLHFDLYGAAVQKLESVEQMERALRFDHDFERRYGGPQSVRWDYFPDRDYSQVANHPLVTGEKRILCIGGINTSFEEHKNNVRYLSKIAGNMPVYSVYNASRGIKRDLEECKMGLNLIGTPPARLHFESKMDFFSSSDKSLLSVEFSQGAILGNISQLMLPEQCRKRTVLIAIAPGVFSPETLWRKSFYYCTKNDLVPKLQKVFGKIPPARDNITYVDTGKVLDVGHKLTHEAYTEYLEGHFERYIDGDYD